MIQVNVETIARLTQVSQYVPLISVSDEHLYSRFSKN